MTLQRCGTGSFAPHLVHAWLLSLVHDCSPTWIPANTLSLFPCRKAREDLLIQPPFHCGVSWTILHPLEWEHLLRDCFFLSFLLGDGLFFHTLKKIISEQTLSDLIFFFFFFFFHNLVGLQFLYVCGYRCQEEEAWGSHASPVAWKLLTLLRNNSLQSPGSKQAGQHILLMPGLQAEWSAHSSEVWWRNVSVPRVPSVVWTPGNLHLGIGEIPKLGETITPTRICVRCSVSSHSEWTSTRMFLWFFVFI